GPGDAAAPVRLLRQEAVDHVHVQQVAVGADAKCVHGYSFLAYSTKPGSRTQPRLSYSACAGRLSTAVDSINFTAPRPRASSTARCSSARAIPRPRAAGATNRSLRISIRAVPTEVNEGYSWTNPSAPPRPSGAS